MTDTFPPSTIVHLSALRALAGRSAIRLALAAAFAATGCSSSDSTPSGGAAGDPQSDAGTPDGTGGGGGAAGAGGGDAGVETGSDAASAACSPPAACTATDPACIALADNAGSAKPGLRMSAIHVTKPTSLATGILEAVVAGNATPSLGACNLSGSGTFSWLLQADTAAGTLKTGGAKPVSDPSAGYSFIDEQVQQGGASIHVLPATTNAAVAKGASFATATGVDVVLPVYLDASATQVLLLPLHQAILTGDLSANGDCIGSYNAAGLDPLGGCQPDSTHPAFLTGGTVTAYFDLEEADTLVVSAISQTLCVALTGDAAQYGQMDTGTGVIRCKRDVNNVILFKGDWCTSTNAAAAGGCADAAAFAIDYAASGVTITN